MNKNNLITPQYLELQRDLHQQPRGYGNSGRKHAGEIIAVAAAMGIESGLDYGAGGGTLKTSLEAAGWRNSVREYDPAIEGIDTPPTQGADLVMCTDVLEHIEPEKLDAVLGHIYFLTQRAAFLVISLTPSSKKLRDGRNAHLLIRTWDWWLWKLEHLGFTQQSRFLRYNESGPSEIVLWMLK
jgi:hypothetical protein